ncbi:MAG: ATP-binding protein [Eubacteriaceae bacterium]|uniref:ATP-binding protein n=1 Tax=Candidatus Pseudoramibacter fermentans TaxID=2594427 RepID=A0A6L5GP91_9FIRM|nr:ATP-binding protein [Candidatus Pseudoramibacter fermentans]RRF92439.1 MAG: ATP-binding protein [Eubacteriaceae bacterium]
MLIQFGFENYKSFKDEAILDLTATKIKELSYHIREVGREKILPTAVIYGANASGKSNVYEALAWMSTYIKNSFGYGDDDDKAPTPFLLDEQSAKADTMFEAHFTLSGDTSGKVYNYGFCVGEKGISEEWLNTKAKTAKTSRRIFYRNGDELDLQGIPKKSRENVEIALGKKTLIVSLGAMLKIEICEKVRNWFANNLFADFGNAVSNFYLSTNLPDHFTDNPVVRDRVVQFLSDYDPQIKALEVKKVQTSDEEQKDYYQINALHQIYGSDQTVPFSFRDESAGTQKMFSLYPFLQNVLETGNVLFVDEMNARLHPLLVRGIINLFTSSETNPNQAQLIFTSHDSWLLSSKVLRRDEIWFTEKDKLGQSDLYALSDFVDEKGDKIRNDENIEKNYLLGKYGAIPEIHALHLVSENKK